MVFSHRRIRVYEWMLCRHCVRPFQAMYGAPGLKPWQSRKWAPPGFATREEAEREAQQKAAAASVEDLVGPRGESQDSQQTALDGSHGPDGHGKEGKMQEVDQQEKNAPA